MTAANTADGTSVRSCRLSVPSAAVERLGLRASVVLLVGCSGIFGLSSTMGFMAHLLSVYVLTLRVEP
jgi:hypothetical protein